METPQEDAKSYIIWLVLSILATVCFVLLVIFNNPETENDALFIIETVGIGLSVGLVSATMLMVFFDARDDRTRKLREKNAAQRISADIKRFLDSKPATATTTAEFREQLEYIRNVFHNDLNPLIITEIDNVLADPTPSREDISALSNTITKKYGKTLFSTKSK